MAYHKPVPRIPDPSPEFVAQQELIEKAFADIRTAFLPQLEALRGFPGSGGGTLTKGMKVCDDYVQVTINAAKAKE